MDPFTSMSRMKILLVGATGLVGRHILEYALADSRVSRLVAPVRRGLPAHAKLSAPVVDFDRLPADSDWWKADAVIFALGTTIKAAGSQEAFRRVDYEYAIAVAKLAKSHGTKAFVLNSALGANAQSRIFYNRVKGEVERDLTALNFSSLTFVRPGLIGGKRSEFRLGEEIAKIATQILHPILPRRWRLNPASQIARKLLEAAIAAKPGQHVISSEELI
jgi:uncharacterized protein YbjT (DUF2867 family)